MAMKFADVKNDLAFRKIFGSEDKKEVLISFLNAVLGFEGDDRIVDVVLQNPFLLPAFRGGKVSIIDVRATDQSKRQFVIEMQVAEQDAFAERALYYLSKSYTSQIKRGDDYRKLQPAIFIGILDFSHTANPHYHSRNLVLDVETGQNTVKNIEFHFIELPKFKKQLSELVTLTDKWVYFIKNAENIDVIPNDVSDAGLKSAYEAANRETWTQAEIDAYDYVYMREEDARAVVDLAVRRAEKKGKEEGKAEGKAEAVMGLHENGVPIGVIAKSLQLTEAEVQTMIAAHRGNE